MALVARVIGLAVLTAGLGAGLGFVLFRQYPDYTIPALVLGCVGGIVGAVAEAAREIVGAQRGGLAK